MLLCGAEGTMDGGCSCELWRKGPAPGWRRATDAMLSSSWLEESFTAERIDSGGVECGGRDRAVRQEREPADAVC